MACQKEEKGWGRYVTAFPRFSIGRSSQNSLYGGAVSKFPHMNIRHLFTGPTFRKANKCIVWICLCGRTNVYLNSRIDKKDYTFSAISIHMKDEGYYSSRKEVAILFVFSRLGIAVPLGPGDILFFNPHDR